MTRRVTWIQFLTAFALLVIFTAGTSAEDKHKVQDEGRNEPQPASLVLNNKRIVTFYTTLDGLSPDERVERASIVLHKLPDESNFSVNSIHAVEGQNGTDIVAADQRIATITEGDAAYNQGNSKLVANDFILKIKYALLKKPVATDAPSLAIDIAFCLVGFLVLVLLIALVCRMSISICDMLSRIRHTKLRGIRIQDAELISADTMVDIATGAIKFGQLSLICLLFTTYVLVSLSFFPGTRPISDALVESARIPLVSLADSVLQYLPKLFTIVVIGLLTYGSMSIAQFFFNALRDGSIRLADFDPDWAEPSYKVARFIIFLFGLVCALPYLPSWDTPAFKQVGLMVGILISLGSSSAISNMMAGIVLTYTNAFRLGDRVCVAEHIGDVTEKTLFVTRLKTPKGEIISIPNAPILAATITNYSVEGKQGKLILHKSVTIGYDVPWRKVTEALLAAAKSTQYVLADPAPFVLQNSLDDFYVTYEINVFTDQPQEMLNIYSELHANIQDAFFQAGLEIMSPHYTCLRDGNKPAIPVEFLPPDYVAPGFKVKSTS